MVSSRLSFLQRCVSVTSLRLELALAGSLLLWAAMYTAVVSGVEMGWISNNDAALVAIALQAVMGVTMLLVYRRFLRKADELQRKIHLDALALSLGVTVVGGMTLSLLVRSALISEFPIEIVIWLTSVTYSAAVMLGQWRYA